MPIQFMLSSRSPRRVEYLRACGYEFDCRPADIEERPQPGEPAAAYAARIALAKARAASGGLPALGADTDVALDGAILGKPFDRGDGIAMLLRLSGRAHQVHSAVALVLGARTEIVQTMTEVLFGDITPQQAADYWASGEPADKAGAYAIQGLGARFVREIRGSYSGVVGLPLYETCELLASFGIRPDHRLPTPVPQR